VHLHCHAIAEVHFRAPGAGEGAKAARSVWFGDKNGVPLLLLVLDVTDGASAAEQAHTFDELHRRHGAMRALVSLDELPPRSAMS